MFDVLIVGGGISGLAAARDLVRAGRRVRLVEARPRLGGVIATEQVEGFTIEAGPDSLLMTKPSAAALCEELGLALVPTLTPRTAFVLRDGHLHAIPPGSVLGLPATPDAIAQASMLSPAGRARLMRDLTQPEPPPPSPAAADAEADGDPHDNQDDQDASIGAVIRRRFGEEAVRYIAQPLLGGIHAGDVERLSMRALFPRIATLDREPGSLLEALVRQRAAARNQADGDQAGDQTTRPSASPAASRAQDDGLFRSIPEGLGTLVDALARSLPAESVSLNASIVRLDLQHRAPATAPHPDPLPAAGRAREPECEPAFAATLSNGDTVHARAVILAVPAYVIASLVAPFDGALSALCRAIPYSSSATITLCYRRGDVDRPLAGTGFVVPRGESATRLLAASWVTSKWANRAPADMVMLRAFAGGTLDPDLLDGDDDDLTTRAHRDLAPLLGLRVPPRLSKVYRWMQAGPQYLVGHLARVAAIQQQLTRHPGLFVAGSGFRGIGIPDTVADARDVAEQVHRWLGAESADKMTTA
jgi:oxygen-dependent protoporphyrinogen oxidase